MAARGFVDGWVLVTVMSVLVAPLLRPVSHRARARILFAAGWCRSTPRRAR